MQNGGQQGAVHESVQNKGNVQRLPIPRNTAGGYKTGNNPMSSVVNGGNANSANPNMPNNRGGNPNISGANKGNSVNIGKTPANVPSAVSGNVKSNVNHSIQNGGGKASVSTDVVNNRSNVKNATQNGGSVSGQSKNTVNVGGNNGSINVSGGSSGGNTEHYAEHTGNEHFTDRSSQRFMEMQTNRNTQINSQRTTTEKRVDHEYKHGRYNPAATNRKVKKSYYQKDNPGGARADVNNKNMNRGENNRNKRKR